MIGMEQGTRGRPMGSKKARSILILPLSRSNNLVFRPGWPGARPEGLATAALDPWEAVETIEERMHAGDCPREIEVAGPGEPLVNESVFAALHLLRSRHRCLQYTVVTNGLALSDRLADLVRCGISHIAVEAHAVSPAAAERIYGSATVRGRRLTGMEAAEAVVRSQWQGIMNAIECGMTVDVRTLRVPGLNDEEICRIAQWAGMLGASSMVEDA